MKKQKALKGLSALLAAAMVLSSAPVPVRASQETGAIPAKAGTEAGFEEGRIQTDRSEEYVDEATGYRFKTNSEVSATITGYELVGSASDNLGNLNIPGTVTGPDGQSYTVTVIGSEAFKSDSRFTGTLTIPDTVTDIYAEAFDGCVSLKGSLIIPDSVVHIEFDAFRECNGMDGELKLSKNLEYIRDRAFMGCSGLNGDITIPAKMKEIGESAFQGCTGFHGHLKFEEGCLENIYKNAFAGMNITGGLEFPGEVWNIYPRAFYECKSLNGPLVFSKGVSYIGEYAFAYCEGLTGNLDLYSGSDVISTVVKDNSFKSCKSLGPVLTLDENTSWDNSLGMYSHSFLYCSGIKKVVNKSNSPFDLSALKSDSGSDPSHSWKDESGNTVYEIKNGTAYRDDYTPGGDDTKTYSITVKEGASALYRDGEKDYRKITSAKKGDTVYLVWLYEGDELEFVRWETENKGVVFQDKYSYVTAFTMPGEDVVISYVEKKKGTETEADATVKVGKKKKMKADGKVKHVLCSPQGMVQASQKGKNVIIKGKKPGIAEVTAYDKNYEQVGYWVIEVVPK